MKNSIVYLMSGVPHLPYLTVSLRTLSDHLGDFDVRVYAWPESYPIVKRIVRDTEFQAYEIEPEYRGRNDQFICKIKLMSSIDCDYGLYLDADTIIRGDVSPFFRLAEEFGFCMTQFNDWGTSGSIIRNRLERLKGRAPIDQKVVHELLSKKWPSVNGGVFSCSPSSTILNTWHAWTMAVKDIFIADETVLHAIMVGCEGSNQTTVVCGGHYNASPKYRPKNLKDEDVVIWHGHGDSFLRPNKSPKGVYLWWPIYQECLKSNYGGIAEWKDECITDSRGTGAYLRYLETVPDDTCRFCGQNAVDWHSKKCPFYSHQEMGV
jgi:hypothetical protein